LVWIDLGDAAEVLTILRTRCGPVHGSGWDQGDFNYGGLVNAADFNDLAANFNQGVSGTTTSGDVATLDAFAAANGLSLPTSSVPEPASAGIMMVRRRRK